MGGISRVETSILAIMVGLQVLLLLTGNVFIATFVPPVIAAVALAFQPLTRDQSFKHMAEKPWRPVIGITICMVAAFAWFAVAPIDIGFKPQMMRALLIDAAIIWLVTLIRVRADVARHGDAI